MNILLLGTPNTGTTYLCDSIQKSNDNIKYYYEFFNPYTCIPEYSKLMYKLCENKLSIEHVYDNSWKLLDLNFTKDVACYFFTDFYIKKFQCFALVRNIENSFPPNHYDVYQYYHGEKLLMMFHYDKLSIHVKNMLSIVNDDNSPDYVQQAILYFYIHQQGLIESCKKYNIPILQYEKLMSNNKNKLNTELNKIIHLNKLINLNKLSDIIFRTKKFKKRDFNSLSFNPKQYLFDKGYSTEFSI